VAAFATFGVAFFFRPVGSILFGHFGDRLGRKRTLIATLLLMGLSTFAIGLLPSAETIGVLAPVVLVVLRALQGLAVGGEWAGAALLTAEYDPAHRRGLYSMFPQLGPGIALALSSLTFLVTAVTMSPEAFRVWGWRIPFLVSVLLVAVGLYIRLKIEETPVFRRVESRGEQVRLPFVEALRHQWGEVLLAGGTLTVLFGFFYIGSVYLTSYAGSAPGSGVLGLSRPTVLIGGLIGALVFAGMCVLSAIWSDRYGRRRVILVGNVLAVVAGPLAFAVMQPGSALSFVVGLVVLMAVVGIPYGPAAAYLPEIFAARYRYTGAGMGYNLAGILGGAVPLIVAPPLTAAYGGLGVGFYLSALGLLSVLCILALPETKGEVLDGTVPATAPA
jgi:MFS family permease